MPDVFVELMDGDKRLSYKRFSVSDPHVLGGLNPEVDKACKDGPGGTRVPQKNIHDPDTLYPNAKWHTLTRDPFGMSDGAQVSTRILGRRTASYPPFLIPHRAPHGVTPRS